MKTKFLTLVLALLWAVSLVASDTSVGGIWYNFNSDGTAEVTGCGNSNPSNDNKYTGAVTIPSSVTYNGKNYSVTSIEKNAFRGCGGLTSITIPNSVTSIGEDAFRYCSNLASITIPNSVTSIGYDAFYDTPWFNKQPDGIVYAGKVAYSYKGDWKSIKSIVLKDGTKGIADYAFAKCRSLTSITIPNSVIHIGRNAFAHCSSLTSITIPNSVIHIGRNAFAHCSSLTSITIPNSCN